MSAEALSQWLHRPPGTWTADDLDRLPPEAPRCEVLDGELIVMSPQPDFHSLATLRLGGALDALAPEGWRVRPEMTVQLAKKIGFQPDLVVVRPGISAPDRTFYLPDEIALAVEIVSPDSGFRDRVVKPEAYARAGIPGYWLIDDVHGTATIHVFKLAGNGRYVETGAVQDKLHVEEPFPITVDVSRLYP